jgi:hypothetical protein
VFYIKIRVKPCFRVLGFRTCFRVSAVKTADSLKIALNNSASPIISVLLVQFRQVVAWYSCLFVRAGEQDVN